MKLIPLSPTEAMTDAALQCGAGIRSIRGFERLWKDVVRAAPGFRLTSDAEYKEDRDIHRIAAAEADPEVTSRNALRRVMEDG